MPSHSKKCCVPNCSSTGQTQHRFPNPKFDLERMQLWLDAIGSEELNSQDPEAFVGEESLPSSREISTRVTDCPEGADLVTVCESKVTVLRTPDILLVRCTPGKPVIHSGNVGKQNISQPMIKYDTCTYSKEYLHL
ncbi:hypothetical protein CBL_03283 [Carabus blaptoides fortunei]